MKRKLKQFLLNQDKNMVWENLDGRLTRLRKKITGDQYVSNEIRRALGILDMVGILNRSCF